MELDRIDREYDMWKEEQRQWEIEQENWRKQFEEQKRQNEISRQQWEKEFELKKNESNAQIAYTKVQMNRLNNEAITPYTDAENINFDSKAYSEIKNMIPEVIKIALNSQSSQNRTNAYNALQKLANSIPTMVKKGKLTEKQGEEFYIMLSEVN